MIEVLNRPIRNQIVGDSVLTANVKENLKFESRGNKIELLGNVLFVEGLNNNLTSAKNLENKGCITPSLQFA